MGLAQSSCSLGLMTCNLGGLVLLFLIAYLFPSVSYCGNLWFHRLRSIHIIHMLCYIICDFNTKTQYVTKQMQMLHFLKGRSIMYIKRWSFIISHKRGLLLTLLQMTNVSQLSYHNVRLLRVGKILRAHV